MQIPKNIAHIWIGPLEPPGDWMRTWPEMNPGWNYRIYDNRFVESRRFINQTIIEAYMERGQYAGAADLIRYELLYEFGGFIAEADSVCIRPLDDLFQQGRLFTVYENEFVRGKLVSPILAAEPGHPFLKALIERLGELDVTELSNPWWTTGNYFVARMIEELQPDVVIFPSHTLIPEHYTGVKYTGDEPVYARQFFGSTRRGYAAPNLLARLGEWRKRRYRKRADKRGS